MLRFLRFFGAVLCTVLVLQQAGAQCTTCASNRKVRVGLRMAATLAGTINTKVYVSGTQVAAHTLSAGSVGYNSSTGRYFLQSFGCAEWPTTVFFNLNIGDKVSEEIVVVSDYVTDNTNPAFSDLSPSAPYLIHGLAFPSAKCLAFWIDPGSGDYVRYEFTPLSGVIYNGHIVARLQVKLDANKDTSAAGSAEGPEAGVILTSHQRSDFLDCATIGSRCGGSRPAGMDDEALAARRPVKALDALDAARTEATSVGGELSGAVEPRASFSRDDFSFAQPGAIVPGPVQEGSAPKGSRFAQTRQGRSASSPAEGPARAKGGTGVASSPPAPTVAAAPIGAVRLPLDLGGEQGRLLYVASHFGADAYSPERLALSLESRVVQRVNDGGGRLRQAMLLETFLDVRTVSPTAIEARFYTPAQVGAFNAGTGLFPITDDTPTVIWRIENPDALPTANRIRFRETRGGVTKTHLATWTAPGGGNAGLLTMSLYDDEVVETREYFLGTVGDANTRAEHVVRRGPGAAGPIAADYVETYQEFYNWGAPGEVFEALIERVDDPSGAALTAQYVYYDTPTMPAGALNAALSPDGYWEVFTRFGGTGEIAQWYRPYRDGPATPYNVQPEDCRYVEVNYYSGGPASQIRVEEEFVLGAGPVARTVLYRDYYSAYGVMVETTNRYLDETSYTQSQVVTSLSSRSVLEEYDTNRSFTQYTSQLGFWNPTTETFFATFTSGLKAKRYFEIEGSLDHPDGVANRTVIRVRVEDERGHAVLEETYVNTGSLPNPSAWTRTDWIERTVRGFDSAGRLASIKKNGRLVYEASYRADGRVNYEIDAAGIRTDYGYDNFSRIASRTRTLAAGDPPQSTTYTYDAAGRVRFETLSATKSGVTLTRTKEKQYDVAGRLKKDIAPDGLTRSFAETILLDSGGAPVSRTATETKPGGATVVSEFLRDRTLFAVTGTGIAPRYFYSDTTVNGVSTFEFTQRFKDENFTVLDEELVRNWRAQVVAETKAHFGSGSVTRTFTYDGGASEGGSIRGLLVRVDEPAHASTLFEHDEFGGLSASGVDLNGNNVLDRSGTDPLGTSTEAYERASASAPWYRALRSYRYLATGSSTATLESERREQLSQLPAGTILLHETLSESGDRITEQVTSNRAALSITRTRRNLAADPGTPAQVVTEIAGLLRTVRKAGATGDEAYTYNAVGEVATKTDPLTGTLSYGRDAGGRVVTHTDSAVPARITTFTYHPNGSPGAGQLASQQDHAGFTTYTTYDLRDRVHRKWGRNFFPTEQVHDAENHVVSVRTFRSRDVQLGGTVDWSTSVWPANAPVGEETQFIYDAGTGMLARKRYADYAAGDPSPVEAVYTYNAANQLQTRTNARGHIATYGYDLLGRVASITYSAGSGTPNVVQTYDRGGRLASITDGSGARTLSYTVFDQPDDDSYTSGLLAGLVVNRGYDAANRASSLAVSGLTTLAYAYDTLARLETVTDTSDATAFTFRYGYEPGNDRLASLEFRRAGVLRMKTSRARDALGRITNVETRDAANALVQQHGYIFDNMDRRTRVDREDGKSWNYGYDARGEVASADKRFAAAAGGQRLAGWQSTYLFDSAGNRIEAAFGGDGAGANLRTINYTTNQLNQYSQASVPDSLWITGDAAASAAVTVEVDDVGQPVVRQGAAGAQEFFAAEWRPSNLATAVYGNVRVKATVAGLAPAGTVGGAWLARTPEAFTYDRDGNLTADGRWSYTWDAENRLVAMETRADAVMPTGALPIERRQRLEFTYDNLSRRVAKKTWRWDTTTFSWVADTERRMLYDGWNLLGEYSVAGAVLTPVRRHVWGLDFSGTPQGAGGTGGLLATKTATAVHAPAIDGNGNVGMYLDLATSTESARFDYDPFGRPLQAVGSAAAELPFRFSTRFEDAETGHVYYGRRYFSPSLGRWLSRDSLGERESPNLYRAASNAMTNRYDVLGRYEEAGHFYTIYNVARAAGYSPSDAFKLAYYAQLPDEVGALDACSAYLAATGDWWHERKILGSEGTATIQAYLEDFPIAVNDWGREIQEVLHSLHGLSGEDLRDRRECLMKMIQDKSLKMWQRGFLLHAYGDTFSHVHAENDDLAAYAYPYGHGEDSKADRIWGGRKHTDPDVIGNFPERYSDYVDSLYEGLNRGPTGEGVLPSYKDILKEAQYTKLKDHSNDAEANSNARTYAEVVFDYKKSPHPEYAPEEGAIVLDDPRFYTPRPAQVHALLELVKKRCCLPR